MLGAVRILRSDDLSADLLGQVRELALRAFGARFSPDDWAHALGGWHVVVAANGALAAHVAVVPRELLVAGVPMKAGYVEAVATDPACQHQGYGSLVMGEVGALLLREFEMGALSTALHGFYERLGWERWRGPTFVRRGSADVRTPDKDDEVMVLRLPRSAEVDVTEGLSCPPRTGGDW